MLQSRFVLGGVLLMMGMMPLHFATSAASDASALRQQLLGLNDHELYVAAITQNKGSDGKMWSKVGACLHNDASKCPTCACSSYTQTNYANPTGYNGLPYSPTVPGTGCAALHGNEPDEITCWPGWAELGLCPANNRGLEALVANQMRLALKNSQVDVCKLEEYIKLNTPTDRVAVKQTEKPAEKPVEKPAEKQPAVEVAYSMKPVDSVDKLPAPKKPSEPAPAKPSMSGPVPVSVSNKKATRSGVIFVTDQKLPLDKIPQKCGLVFPGPSGSDAFAELNFKFCLGLSRVIRTKGVITTKVAKLEARTAMLSKKDLLKVDQKCHAGLGRFIEGRARILSQFSKEKPDLDRVLNELMLLEDASDRMKDSVRACIDRNLKIDH